MPQAFDPPASSKSPVLSGLEKAMMQMRRWMEKPAARGSFWTIVSYGSTQALRLLGNVLLSRLLFPEAFGILAIVNVFVQGLQMFSDVGIGPSIIQHPRGEDPLFVNTAWTIQAVRGMLLALCSFILAWPLAVFYDQPQLFPLICVAGLTAAISGFNSTILFTVRRSLNLGGITLLEIGAQAAGILVNCIWAWISPSVWALMAGAIVSNAVRMTVSHLLNRKATNRWAWDRDACRELLKFGRWIALSTVIAFCAMQGDRILLSKLVSLEMLGVYTVALTVALLPNVLLSTLVFSVLYPLLCQTGQANIPDFEARLLRVRGSLLSFGLLLVMVVGAGAELFYHVLYDRRYYDAIWMTQLMCVPVWMMVLNTTLETSLLALGDSRRAAACGFVRFVACTLASLAGFQLFGIPGFILGLGAGVAIGQMVLHWVLGGHDIGVIRQDIQFTATIGACGILAAVANSWVPHGALVVAALVCATAIMYQLRNRQSQSILATEGAT
jgi:O-antigen/teichoic acid export membrane protein